jgi:hypothetical protein
MRCRSFSPRFLNVTLWSTIMRAVRAYALLRRQPVLSMFHDEEVRLWYTRLKGCSVKIRWICRFHRLLARPSLPSLPSILIRSGRRRPSRLKL